MKPEQRSRSTIAEALQQAGWILQGRRDANITAGRGVAIREFPLSRPHRDLREGLRSMMLRYDG